MVVENRNGTVFLIGEGRPLDCNVVENFVATFGCVIIVGDKQNFVALARELEQRHVLNVEIRDCGYRLIVSYVWHIARARSRARTLDKKHDSRDVFDFVSDCCEAHGDPDGTDVTTEDFITRFSAYCQARGRAAEPWKYLAKKLKSMGVVVPGDGYLGCLKWKDQ